MESASGNREKQTYDLLEGIEQRYKRKLVNDLNVEPKSRWPLDKTAPYMKGPGLKL